MARPQRKVPWLVWRDGVAYAHWYDAETRREKRVSLRSGDPAEAQARFAAFLVEGGVEPANYAGQLTVSEALDQYRAEHVAHHCADPRRQEGALIHLKSFFGDTPLSDVDIPMSRRYADARRTGRVGVPSRRRGNRTDAEDGTIRRELGALAAAAKHALRWKRITVMPSVELTKERVLGVDDEAPYFDKAEIAMLTDLAEGELRWFIELAYLTGARRASIEDLEWSQVRWDAHRIILQKPGKRTTKKRQPIVPILPEMEAALYALKAMADDSQGRVFRTRDFYHAFRNLCEGLGFGGRSNPHMLRHSRATHLLQDGVSLYAVARLLGDTVATIERVYGHHSHERLAGELTGAK